MRQLKQITGIAVVFSAVLLATHSAALADTSREQASVDRAMGFGASVIAPHATVPEEVATRIRIVYGQGDRVVAELADASTLVVAEVSWEPGGTTGWHTHPGPVLVNVTEGALEVVNARDCVSRRYEAGQAFIDPGQGNVHAAMNASDTDRAAAIATFLGVPDGGAPTQWVAPVEC